jgi:AraC-like DNA-binding protein
MLQDRQLRFDRLIAEKTYYEAGLQMPRHTDALSRISITMDGESEEITDTGHAILNTSTLLVKPNTAFHENTFGKKGCTILSIQFPDETLFPEKFRQWACYRHPGITVLGLALWTELKKAKNDKVVNDVLRRLCSMIEKLQSYQGQKKHLLYAASVLSGESEEKKSIQDISNELSLHRVYFSRSFTKQYAISPAAYVQQERLVKTAIALRKKENTLTAAAYEAGYSDQSHMIRSVKKIFGVTPSRLRDYLQ